MANALLAKDPAETCVLVTGGAGFIGSHTVVELLERNYQVVIVDDLSNSSREAVRRVGEITGVAPVFADLPNEEEAEAVAAVAGAAVREVAPGPSLTFYEANILDRAALETIFTMHAVDVIIHFAGFKAVGESVAKPLEYYWNNIAGTLVLCEVAREHGCKNIVFSSSATVYGEPEFVPITESCPKHDATNPYGWTKSMLEQILSDLYTGDNEWNVVLLRYFNPIGAHESGRIGEDPKGIPNNLLPYVAQVAVGKLEQVGVFGDDYPTPDGTGVRDYIHVSDLADAHIAALKYLDRDERKYDVFNVGTGEGTSVRQIVDEVKKVTGLPFKETVMGRRAGDPPHLIGSPERINTEMGWHAKYDVEDIVESAWNAWQANPDHHIDVETWKQTD